MLKKYKSRQNDPLTTLPVACQSVSEYINRYISTKENRIKKPPANVKNIKEKIKFGINNIFMHSSLRKDLIENVTPIVSGVINAKNI
ncbi:hypothetical protein [Bacillus sp. HUB-I-004]|uniref:hypothetical protein n=1 Tax=Bacillus sp. HUB-I-004 TaxID=2568878 RepID=UPI0014555B3C|nr:hypothetical protein [Bacillus sp. HUB-I-004]